MWKIGYPIDGVWFNISSAKADGKYLTVTKIGNLKELTMEKGGTVCIANYMIYQLLLQCISWQSGHTARSIEIVLRGGPSKDNFYGSSDTFTWGLYIDEF